MKKVFYGILVLALLVLGIGIYWIMNSSSSKKEKETTNKQENIQLKEDLTVPFLENVHVSDFIEQIDAKIVDDYVIKTDSLGKQDISFEFISEDGSKGNYTFSIEVVDVKAPITLIGGSYNVVKGSKDDFVENIFCGDDYDSHPKCTIEGEYDLNTIGTYPVIFRAEDSSGNVFQKQINLNVYVPSSGGSTNPTTSPKTSFSDVIKQYKTNNTKIGIDVSKWQGDINFDALKASGVEFIIIRVGTMNAEGKQALDPKFVQNITNANRVGIPVGLYFYSYASTKEDAISDAKWIIEQIKDYQVDLPIAFDWENWSSFNSYGVSFYELTGLATTFSNTLKEAGYQGMLYSSKRYLENIWTDYSYPTWLAHYTSETDYAGDYEFWQLCNNGRVTGINGDVDIDIWYPESNEE